MKVRLTLRKDSDEILSRSVATTMLLPLAGEIAGLATVLYGDAQRMGKSLIGTTLEIVDDNEISEAEEKILRP